MMAGDVPGEIPPAAIPAGVRLRLLGETGPHPVVRHHPVGIERQQIGLRHDLRLLERAAGQPNSCRAAPAGHGSSSPRTRGPRRPPVHAPQLSIPHWRRRARAGRGSGGGARGGGGKKKREMGGFLYFYERDRVSGWERRRGGGGAGGGGGGKTARPDRAYHRGTNTEKKRREKGGKGRAGRGVGGGGGHGTAGRAPSAPPRAS